MNELNELSLFSGYGGLSLGLKLAGLNTRTVMYVEYERYPQEILKARIKDGAIDDAPIWADISTLRGEQLRGLVDVITAGFPCQPHSVAGQRRGETDDRNLWPETLRVIREVGPRYVLLENVPGILTSSRGLPSYAGIVVGQLAEAGFHVRWTTMGADDVGGPHRRKRWFCWAVADSDKRSRIQRKLAEGSGYPIRESGQLADSSSSRTWVETHRDSGQGRQFAHPQQSTVLPQEHRPVSTEGTHTNIPNVANAGHDQRGGWNTLREAEGQPGGEAGANQEGSGRRESPAGFWQVGEPSDESPERLVDDPQPVRLTESQEPRGTGPRVHAPAGEKESQQPTRPSVGTHRGQGMADSKIEGLEGVGANSNQEGRQEPNGSVGYRSRTIPTWPPRPSDAEGWARVLADRPDLAPALSKEAQSGVRGVVDGSTSRVGELKALGNGVVPAVVAAFLRQCIREVE